MKTFISPVTAIYYEIVDRCLEPDETTILTNFLQSNNLNSFIDETIAAIEKIIESTRLDNFLKSSAIKTIAYKALKKFNNVIKQLEGEEKLLIKALLSKIAKGILLETAQQAPFYAADIKRAIHDGFSQAVLLEGYDKDDFNAYMQLDYINISSVPVVVTSVTKQAEYLVWTYTPEAKEELFRLLFHDYNCIKSMHEIKTLFDQPDANSPVKWNNDKIDMLVLLFKALLDRKWMAIRRGKGIWTVLGNRIVDFRKNPFTINFTKRLYALRKNPTLNNSASIEVAQIIQHLQTCSKR